MLKQIPAIVISICLSIVPVSLFNQPSFNKYRHPRPFQVYENDKSIVVNAQIIKMITPCDEELLYDELDLLALLCFAEAGNQGVKGMQYVCDVVLNRVDSPLFPNTITEVINQEGQFGPISSGGIEKAGWNITEEAYEAVRLEYFGERLDDGILYFNTTWDNGINPWKYGDHWFSY